MDKPPMQSKELSYDILSCFGHKQNYLQMEENAQAYQDKKQPWDNNKP